MSEQYREWPPYFDEWPRQDQVAYLKMRYQRDELIQEIGRRAGIDSMATDDRDPSTARLSKDELAELALFVGAHLNSYSKNAGAEK